MTSRRGTARTWLARSAIVALIAIACAPMACGGGDDGSLFQNGTDDGGTGDDGNVGPDLDASFSGDGTSGDGTIGNCTPKTCAQLAYTCGKNLDGCGNVIDCGACTSPQFCGGAGFSKCGGNTVAQDGGNPCVPKTCASLGYNCGPAGDGCGGLITSCGTCTAPNICGGGGMPSVCGNNVSDAGPPCTGLCTQIVNCDGGAHTTISGTVYAPTNPALGYGQPDPVPNVLVYIPNAPLQPFPTTVSCQQCGAQASGSPLVTATTDYKGNFTLTDVPVGSNITLVMQIGRWRRQVQLPTINACVPNVLVDKNLTRLPRNHNEGDIPHFAIVTGNADPIECVLPKIGIDLAEFGDPSANTRVGFYRANGASYSGATPLAATLTGSTATLANYDVVIFDCEGSQINKTPAALANMLTYTGSGGRIYASHYSYAWGFTNDPWGCGNGCVTPMHSTANWQVDQVAPPNLTGFIDQGSATGMLLAQWLQYIGASTTLARIPVQQVRKDSNGILSPPTTQLMYADPAVSPNTPLEFSFNTPAFAPPAMQCGRFMFSDFHVNTGGVGAGTFPGSCGAASPMTPQEKVLEFMLFDLTSCIQPTGPTPMCTPRTCAQQMIDCGPAGDGCGNLLQCGTCVAPQQCGAGGTPGQCALPDGGSCVPKTCMQLGVNCGPAGDGCGGLITSCGTCGGSQTCGGGGTPGQCGGGPR